MLLDGSTINERVLGLPVGFQMVILQNKFDEARSVGWGGRHLPADEAAQLVVHVCCRPVILAGNMKSAAPLAIEGKILRKGLACK